MSEILGACIDENLLVDLIEGRIAERSRADIDGHIDGCGACRALLAAASADPLAHALTEAPRPRGSVLARYLILEVVGAGASGVVYAAYDPELGRKVAIKVLRPTGDGDEAARRGRTMREAQAMARLSHGNVVSIYDVGAVDDKVFVVMELIDGITLRRWNAAASRSWREVVSVFLLAGRGLAAAHDAGLVHRDFKPDNVLIADDGRVLVTDFGLARAADPAARGDDQIASAAPSTGMLTRNGPTAGTPAYMAPEQLAGEPIDARSDLFGFCVALYEALYQQRPFAGESLNAIEQQIRDGQVQAPPRRSRVPVWIHRILLRGLRARPEERPASMSVLLDALGHDPARRRRTLYLALVLTAIAGVGGLFAWRWQSEQRQICKGGARQLAAVWGPARRDQVRQAFLTLAQVGAEQAFAATARGLDEYGETWRQAHAETCEATHVRREQSAEMLDLRMACLDERLSQLRALTELLVHADGTLVRRAAAASRSLESTGTCAAQLLLRAGARLPENAGDRARYAALETQLAAVKALDYSGRFADEVAAASEAREAARRAGWKALSAEASFYLGLAESQLGHLDRSDPLLLEAATQAQAAARDDIAALAFAYAGMDLAQEKRFPEAHLLIDLSAAAIERLGGREDLKAFMLGRKASALTAEYRAAEAAPAYEEAIAIEQRVSGPRSLRLASLWVGMARTLTNLNRNDEALAAVRRGTRIYLELFGPDYPLLATALLQEGHVLRQLDRKAEAISVLQRAVEAREHAFGVDHPNVVEALFFLGHGLTWAGRPAEAARVLERAIETGDRINTPYEDVPLCLAALGEAWVALGDPQRAVGFFERALGHPKAAQLDAARSFVDIEFAKAAWAAGQRRRAVGLAEHAREVLRKASGVDATRELAEADAWLRAHRP
jgi:tetratricopeptide (TPR) repeat protein/tRNA A-37 threonylcarbamoyl transferase component Bud32